MEYRRTLRSDTWHFCTNCVDWPKGVIDEDYRERLTKGNDRPSYGELCNKCLQRQKLGDCNVINREY